MIIQNNIGALSANRQMQLNMLKLQTNLQRLSSGYRINSAADDAAGLAISERMRSQITGTDRAIMNSLDASSLVQTAEGGLTEVHGMLNRLTELAGQAANGTLQQSQRDSIQKEAQDLLKEIDRISQATNFNGIKLLDGSLSGSQPATTQGAAVAELAPTAGKNTYNDMAQVQNLAAGDSVKLSMGLDNGDSFNMSFTVNSDLSSVTTEDGTVIALNSSTVSGGQLELSGEDFASIAASQLQNSGAAQHYTIAANGDSLSLENREAGTNAPQITSLSYSVGDAGPYTPVSANISVQEATDAQRYVSQNSLRVFDGSNEAQATFSVNGERFALVSSADYASQVQNLADRGITAVRVDGTSGSTLTGDDLQRITGEINQKTGLALEADTVNGRIMLKDGGSGEGLKMQIGETAASHNQIAVKVSDMSSAGLGIAGINLSSQEGAARALSRINTAIDRVSSQRGALGATQNRLNYTIRNLQVSSENTTAAESRIRDVDMAKEMMRFVKNNVLSQASQSMLAQANMQTQQVLQLLR